MPRLAFGTILLLCLHTGFAYGTDCSFGNSDNFIQKVINTCPRPFESSDKSYCCYDLHKSEFYCCDAEEFAVKTGLGIIVPAIITSVIIVSLIVCCISCLCCSCCPWYRRRRQGTVYGKVQAPSVVHVVQTNVPPSYNQAAQMARVTQAQTQAQGQENHYAPYPMNPAGFPQPPPQYTNDAYAKQAPYNPSYPPQ